MKLLLCCFVAGLLAIATFGFTAPGSTEPQPELPPPVPAALIAPDGDRHRSDKVIGKPLVSTARPAQVRPPFDNVSPETIERMAGQMIITGFAGLKPAAKTVREVRQLLAEGKLGGVIFMGWNVRSRAQVTALTQPLHEAAGNALVRGEQLPPFVSIDQEGGGVQRLKRKHGFRNTYSAYLTAKRLSPMAATNAYKRLAWQLADAGFNMNFGPVLDINRNANSPIIAKKRRAYGTMPGPVITYARAFIDGHRQAGVLTVAKHFPGHGSSRTDSHFRAVDLTKTWDAIELAPYEALFGTPAAPDGVMIGHLYHPRFSHRDKRPASLSKVAIYDELRGKLKFGGLVITDDLDMRPVRQLYPDPGERAVQGILAGSDIVLFSTGAKGGRGQVDRIRHAIVEAVLERRLPMVRIERSFKRIVAAKRWLRSIDTSPPLPVRQSEPKLVSSPKPVLQPTLPSGAPRH
jgi:beta-N-acetylhexosaminidase